MKKSELLELLKDLDDNADINSTLEGVEGLIKPIGLEEFKNVLKENKEIAAYVQSTIDSGIGKGVASFKEKTLPGLIEEGIKKANNKNKSPEAIALEELQAKFKALETEKAMAESKSNITKLLNERKLPLELVDFLPVGHETEEINLALGTLEGILNNYGSLKVKEKLGDSNYNPPAPGGETTIGKTEFNKMSYKEKLNLYNTDKELYDKLNNE